MQLLFKIIDEFVETGWVLQTKTFLSGIIIVEILLEVEARQVNDRLCIRGAKFKISKVTFGRGRLER